MEKLRKVTNYITVMSYLALALVLGLLTQQALAQQYFGVAYAMLVFAGAVSVIAFAGAVYITVQQGFNQRNLARCLAAIFPAVVVGLSL